MLHGGGSNGKSTLIRILLHVLGDYGQTTPATTLLARDRDSANSNDLARMAGVRFVSAVETEDGKRLAESLIKQITGGDTSTARFLHKEYFELQPKFKLWFATNHRPVIKGADEAIWRRILLIPFAVHITTPDKSLPERLAAEASGILNGSLEGCRKWQELGSLDPPAEVRAAVAGYREEQDILAAFLEECCIQNAAATAPVKGLYKAYVEWATENNERALTNRQFSQRLSERGFSNARRGMGGWTSWLGLGSLLSG